MPSVFAAQAYDSAKLIDAAVREVHARDPAVRERYLGV
jgi:hypothetical protein